jgi:hypothetical protein
MQQFRFTDLFNTALHVSGANYAHPQECIDCFYSFWYDTPTLLPIGDTVKVLRRCIITKAVKTVKVLLKMGVISARNMQSCFERINKPKLLHLVCCLYCCNDFSL